MEKCVYNILILILIYWYISFKVWRLCRQIGRAYNANWTPLPLFDRALLQHLKTFSEWKKSKERETNWSWHWLSQGGNQEKGMLTQVMSVKSRVAEVVTLSASEKCPQKLSSGAQLLICDKCVLQICYQKGNIGKRSETNLLQKILQST